MTKHLQKSYCDWKGSDINDSIMWNDYVSYNDFLELGAGIEMILILWRRFRVCVNRISSIDIDKRDTRFISTDRQPPVGTDGSPIAATGQSSSTDQQGGKSDDLESQKLSENPSLTPAAPVESDFAATASINSAVAPASAEAKDPSLQARIRRHVPKLVRFLEPDFGLLDELLSMHILDDMQIADVRAGVNIYEQNNRMLEYFKDKPDDVCQKFLAALKKTQQHHLANYIEYDGGQLL